REGVLKEEDAAYFQVFSIPGQKNSIAFNCPRISSDKELDPLNAEDVSYAYKQGRKQIRRLAEFCKKYLSGFEEAYVSQIAPQLGVRDSRRINGLYKLTEEDILNAKKFDNKVAKSNYPVDVHAKEKGKNELKHLPPDQYYEIPLESLIPENIENLLVVGRCISTTFKAQASIRIQPNCWSMGEYAGKYVADKIKS
ncbi:MAG TPA: FAD-dependent oxidoreductase, partial [Cyanobacteria bacterium UBA9971]|nr:FAD-dependent oxidoreductase [Cyanobacteria bacterium UBA9971]